MKPLVPLHIKIPSFKLQAPSSQFQLQLPPLLSPVRSLHKQQEDGSSTQIRRPKVRRNQNSYPTYSRTISYVLHLRLSLSLWLKHLNTWTSCWLMTVDYVCPFSAKMFNTVYTSVFPLIEKKYASKVQILFRQQIQPWHPSSTLVHEAGVAVLKLQPGKFWDFSKVPPLENPSFFKSC